MGPSAINKNYSNYSINYSVHQYNLANALVADDDSTGEDCKQMIERILLEKIEVHTVLRTQAQARIVT